MLIPFHIFGIRPAGDAPWRFLDQDPASSSHGFGDVELSFVDICSAIPRADVLTADDMATAGASPLSPERTATPDAERLCRLDRNALTVNAVASGVRDLAAVLIGLTLAFWTEDLARVFGSQAHAAELAPEFGRRMVADSTLPSPEHLDLSHQDEFPSETHDDPKIAADVATRLARPADVANTALDLDSVPDTHERDAIVVLPWDAKRDEAAETIADVNLAAPEAASTRLIGTDENDILVGTEGNDIILAGAGDDLLDGGRGDDILIGGIGSDTIIGGSGNDVLVIDGAGDTVVELENDGTDTVIVLGQTPAFTLADLPNIENAILLGEEPASLAGNSLDNVLVVQQAAAELFGDAGNDVLISGASEDLLDGGLGQDILVGGKGNDTYVVDDIADAVIETVDGGVDTVLSNSNVAVLADNVENLIFVGNGSFIGIGNESANTIWGGEFDDQLYGDWYDGLPEVPGAAAPDARVADVLDDAVLQAALTEILGEPPEPVFSLSDLEALADNKELSDQGVFIGDTGGDKLSGRSGRDDLIYGGGGNDRIDGGTGNDTLIGGIGNDTFVFRKGFGNDVVTDFANVAGDRDIVIFDHNLVDDGYDIADHIEQVGQDVVIYFSPSESLTLQNVDMMKLSINDQFIFS